MTVYMGDDWSEDHHDVHVMNEEGESLAAKRLPEGAEGMIALQALLAEHAQEAGQVVVGIETDRGPWVATLIGAGYRVYAINPRVAALYRERHQIGGGKSDRGDARMLANLVRTDSRNHRPVAGDSALASAVQVCAEVSTIPCLELAGVRPSITHDRGHAPSHHTIKRAAAARGYRPTSRAQAATSSSAATPPAISTKVRRDPSGQRSGLENTPTATAGITVAAARTTRLNCAALMSGRVYRPPSGAPADSSQRVEHMGGERALEDSDVLDEPREVLWPESTITEMVRCPHVDVARLAGRINWRHPAGVRDLLVYGRPTS